MSSTPSIDKHAVLLSLSFNTRIHHSLLSNVFALFTIFRWCHSLFYIYLHPITTLAIHRPLAFYSPQPPKILHSLTPRAHSLLDLD